MQFLAETIRQIKQQNLFRETVTYEPHDPVHVKAGGQDLLLLASNNYLGLTHHPAVQQAAAEAALKWGTGSGGSRLTTGSHPLFAVLEHQLAQFKGTEAAIVFNTGYMANVGTISALAGAGDVVFSDELNHASIIDGCHLAKARTVIYRHSDMADLARCLGSTHCEGRRLIVTDGVFSMDGDIAPLPQIVELARQYDAMVMVDDAHAAGVIGPSGRGTAAYYGLEQVVDVQLGTLSKALAAEGAYVAGSQLLIDYLTNRARSFIFSTALSPAAVASAIAALSVLMANPALVRLLQEKAQYFIARLQRAGFALGPSVTPIVPLLVGDAKRTVVFAERLLAEGLVVSAIRPPTVPLGTSRLRMTVTAAHTLADLDQAAAAICQVGRE
ncbi:MAG TPA: 8-amino-7-oxononanoate synthase [Armatimonadota bacterium]|nr:8-amino-7-oxononanoate synthase [Armatimonadota bacterium]